jgi:Ice-binding-like
MKHFQKHVSASLLSLTAFLSMAPLTQAWAASPPALGAAAGFAVLSAAPGGTGAVTCTDSSIGGNVGSSGLPVSVTQTNCTISGTVTAPVSSQVLADFNRAYDQYASIPCTGLVDTAYTGQALTLAPGVYCNAAAVTFTDSTLTLDAQGNANAVWIFKIGTAGTGALTGTNFAVVLANGAQACNVDWRVAQAVTTTVGSFQGNILSGAAITMTGLAGTLTPLTGNAQAKAGITLTNVALANCIGNGNGNGNGGGHDNDKDHDKDHDNDHDKDHKNCSKDSGKGHGDCDHDDDSHMRNPFGSKDKDGDEKDHSRR